MIVKLCVQHDSVARVNQRQLVLVFISWWIFQLYRHTFVPYCKVQGISNVHGRYFQPYSVDGSSDAARAGFSLWEVWGPAFLSWVTRWGTVKAKMQV